MRSEKIIEEFKRFFREKKYHESTELPLITPDNSLNFTNSTIVAWKTQLLQRQISAPGVFMKQRCLRLRCLNDQLTTQMTEEVTFQRFLGNFNMLGILTPPSRMDEVQKDILHLLLEKYGLHPENILIDTNGKQEFIEGWTKQLPMRVGSLKDSSYVWRYGLENCTGSGATINLRQADDSFKEIGQLIQIEKDSEILGYEFGFGVETFSSRASQDSTYSAWTIAKATPTDLRFKAYLDAVGSYCFTCSTPSASRGKNHNREIRRLANHIIEIERIAMIKPEITDATLAQHSYLEFDSADAGKNAIRTLNEARQIAEETKRRFRDVVKSLAVRKYSPEKINSLAREINAKQYHLPEEVAYEIIIQP